MKLGESDELLGDEKAQEIEIPAEARKITVDKNGVITVPAVACVKPVNSNDRIFFMKSLTEELLIHYSRLGKRPELIKYYIEAPKAGEYELTANVVTVARNQSCLLRLNRRTLIDLPLPFSLGKEQATKPVKLTLKKGRNTLMFTCKAPNRGVTIKQFVLKPVE